MKNNKTLSNINNFTSEKLCEIIVSNRYLGIFSELVVPCMEELSKRRLNGSNFDYENYIEKSFQELPVIESNVLDIGSLIFNLNKGFKNE